jgi:hypothetical protein
VIGSRARRILVSCCRVARLSIGPSEGVLVLGESRLGFAEIVSQCLGFGRLVVQPRGVAFLGGVLLPGGPGMLVALLLFVLLLR